jgi:hypothetical protein
MTSKSILLAVAASTLLSAAYAAPQADADEQVPPLGAFERGLSDLASPSAAAIGPDGRIWVADARATSTATAS